MFEFDSEVPFEPDEVVPLELAHAIAVALQRNMDFVDVSLIELSPRSKPLTAVPPLGQ